MSLTSKQRAYLISLGMNLRPCVMIGKEGLTPEVTQNAEEALAANELIKLGVLKNCEEDPREIADMIAERTRSVVVHVIGKKIVLYREGKDEKKKIELPRQRKEQSKKPTE